MMASFLSLYGDIEQNIKQAIALIAEKSEENRKLKEEIEEQNKEIKRLQNELQSLKEKQKLLTITNTVLYKEDKKETIKKINEYVREIDNCIELLNRMEWKKTE